MLEQQKRSASPAFDSKAAKAEDIQEEEKVEVKTVEAKEPEVKSVESLAASNSDDAEAILPEAVTSPVKNVKPTFLRSESLTRFVDPDPLKVSSMVDQRSLLSGRSNAKSF